MNYPSESPGFGDIEGILCPVLFTVFLAFIYRLVLNDYVDSCVPFSFCLF